MLAIAFYIIFSSVTAWCVKEDIKQGIQKDDTKIERNI